MVISNGYKKKSNGSLVLKILMIIQKNLSMELNPDLVRSPSSSDTP